MPKRFLPALTWGPDTGGRNLNWEQASFDWDDSTIRFWANV
jgi:hypothetical protein